MSKLNLPDITAGRTPGPYASASHEGTWSEIRWILIKPLWPQLVGNVQ